jgi:hypothetical protein
MDLEITEGVRLLFTYALERGESAPIDSVTAFVAQQRTELEQFRAAIRSPGDPARRSLDLLDEIELRANQLRAAIADGCSMSSPDRFGPTPDC